MLENDTMASAPLNTTERSSYPNSKHILAAFSTNYQHMLCTRHNYCSSFFCGLELIASGRRNSTWNWLFSLVTFLVAAYQVELVAAQEQYLVKTLTGHSNTVSSVAWSPDGTQLASGSFDNTIRIWNAMAGYSLQTLRGHTSGVESVAWSPDGEKLASGSGNIFIWNPRTGQSLRTLTGQNFAVNSVAWSLDGKQLASGGLDDTISIWNPSTGQSLQTLTEHTNNVLSVAWSPDGMQLASGSADYTIRIWNPGAGQSLLTLTGHTGWVRSVAWSPDGTKLASGSADFTIHIWNASTGQSLQNLTGHTDWVYSVAWNPDGTQLASGSWDDMICIWDPSTGELLRTLRGHTNNVFSVAWSPNGTQLASASSDDTIRIWDPALHSYPTPAPSPNPSSPSTGAPTPNPTMILSGVTMKLVGVDELDVDDRVVFETVTATWCEWFFAENQDKTQIRDLKTTILVAEQDVAPSTDSPPMKTSNTLTYVQTMAYTVTSEKADIVPEHVLTAPFSDRSKNQVYLETLARSSPAFTGIDTQVLTIPRLEDSDLKDETKQMAGDTSDGFSRIIIGVVVATISFVVLLFAGFAIIHRWNKSRTKLQEHAPRPDPVFPQSIMPTKSPTEFPAVPAVARQPTLPALNDSNHIEPIANDDPEHVLEYKDQNRSHAFASEHVVEYKDQNQSVSFEYAVVAERLFH